MILTLGSGAQGRGDKDAPEEVGAFMLAFSRVMMGWLDWCLVMVEEWVAKVCCEVSVSFRSVEKRVWWTADASVDDNRRII